MTTHTLQSPTLQRLHDLYLTQDAAGLATLWAEIRERGTPLIEPIEGDDEHQLVTFLYDGGEEAIENIVIYATFPSCFWNDTGRMQLLEGTNVWFLTDKAPNGLRSLFYFFVNDDPAIEWNERFNRGRQDPLNLRPNVWCANEEGGDLESHGSMLELDDAVQQPWIYEQEGVAKGTLETLRFQGSDGVDRRVFVYTPHGYRADGEYEFLMCYDGFDYVYRIPTPTILDNALAEGALPPTVAVFVDHPDRFLELQGHEPFYAMIENELIPWVRENYAVTRDPQRSTIAGLSLSGMGAAYTAYRNPHVFGNLLAQCGSWWFDPSGERYTNWMGRLMTQEKLPLNIYMELGTLEGPNTTRTTYEMLNTLREFGYDVEFQTYVGGHDYTCWRVTMANGLLALAHKKNPRY